MKDRKFNNIQEVKDFLESIEGSAVCTVTLVVSKDSGDKLAELLEDEYSHKEKLMDLDGVLMIKEDYFSELTYNDIENFKLVEKVVEDSCGLINNFLIIDGD
jgi:hypothetical protein